MRIEEQSIAGLYLITLERSRDDRGYFARTYCRDTFVRHGLEDCANQCSVSHNRVRGTLRGLHLQLEPHGETKLVRCTRGRVWDVAVDLRAGSPTRGQWLGFELSPENGLSLYIPRGFAHGFLTLEDVSDVYYQMAEAYVPAAAAGVRWDDPELAITWPEPPVICSESDRALPALSELQL